jgi:hypothetical protein
MRGRARLLATAGLCICAGTALAAENPAASGPRADVPVGRGDAAAISQASFRLGVLDEGNRVYGQALAHYRACIDAAPASRLARTARARITWIEQRSEADFVPLEALQRVRGDPARVRDLVAIDRLAVEAESFPPGLVRSEARLLVAEAWLRQPARRADALGELRQVVGDPLSAPADSRYAERDLVEGLLTDGRLDDAAREARAHPFDPQAAAEVRRLLRRRLLRRAAYAELLAALLLAMALTGRARASRRRAAREAPAGHPIRRRPLRAMVAILVLAGVSTIAVVFVVTDPLGSKPLPHLGL